MKKYWQFVLLMILLVGMPVTLASATSGPILPFYRGSQATYGSKGVHECGFGLAGWKAVDLLPQQNQIYAVTGGEISSICRDSHQVSYRIGDNFYAHVRDTGQANGDQYAQGQALGEMVTGTYNDTCGYTQQGPSVYHVHFCFVPSGGSYQIDGYTLNTTTGIWSKGGDTVATGGALTSTWEGVTTPTINGSLFNVFDWLLKGLQSLLMGLLYPLLPPGSTSGSVLNAIKLGSALSNGVLTVFELTVGALSTFSWVIPLIALTWFLINWSIQLGISLYLFITDLIKHIPFL